MLSSFTTETARLSFSLVDSFLKARCVRSDTIKKCFRKGGILDRNFQVVRLKTPTEDPFCDLDSEDEENKHDSELEELLLQANIPDCCSVENFISADNDIPTCVDLDNVNWEQDFLSELCHSNASAGEDDDDDDDDQSSEVVPPPLKVASYAQALLYLEDVQAFLEHKGNTLEACEIMGFLLHFTAEASLMVDRHH